MGFDFSGWATKNDLKCTDGRTIMHGAFKSDNGRKVPLVWQHNRNDPDNILGHAVLEHRDEGTYAYCSFNNSPKAQTAKEAVFHGDITMMSIYANRLKERGKEVIHGVIREVSLVLSGANPGAMIENLVFQHGDDYETDDTEAIIHTGLTLELIEEPKKTELAHEDGGEDSETVQDVFNTLNEKQKNVVYFMIGQALDNEGDSAEHSDDNDADDAIEHNDNSGKEGTSMTRNVFDQTDGGDIKTSTLTHSQLATLLEDGRKCGSLKDSLLAHADDYGITNIEMLFPDAKAISNTPEWITRRMEWVEGVLNGTKKIPWSKIKSMSADLTHEEARAKGYIKASMKKEQFFSIAKRETGPKTIYKKQKLDKDDITDITDFDVVAWIWVEMNFMLREEIARAILIGDGREVDDPDKIDEDKIRPIAHDDAFYTDVVTVPANVGGSSLVEAVIRARESYKGSGEPTAYMTRNVLNDMLLVKDKLGRRLYRNRAELAAELEVSNIVLVPVMEGHKTDDGDMLMFLVNLSDYTVGSTRGGEITKFDDFDIDYNQYKYLIEGRMSGALTKHKSAQVIVRTAGTMVTPTVPTFVASTGVVTIPSITGVTYKNQETDVTLTAGAQAAIVAGATISIVAVPNTGYYFPHNFDADWDFTRTT